MRVCLAVTCHLHFWQNDRDLLRVSQRQHGGYVTAIFPQGQSPSDEKENAGAETDMATISSQGD